jgi:hypothetical protein
MIGERAPLMDPCGHWLDLEALRQNDRDVVGLTGKTGEMDGRRPVGVAERATGGP